MNKITGTMTETIETLLKEIEEVLHENAGEKITRKEMFSNVYLENVEGGETEVMLRFWGYRLRKITIARIAFTEKGTGSLKKGVTHIRKLYGRS